MLERMMMVLRWIAALQEEARENEVWHELYWLCSAGVDLADEMAVVIERNCFTPQGDWVIGVDDLLPADDIALLNTFLP